MSKKELETMFFEGSVVWAKVQEAVPVGKKKPLDTECSLLIECDPKVYKELKSKGFRAKLRPANQLFGKEKEKGKAGEEIDKLDDYGEPIYRGVPEDLKELEGKSFIQIRRDVEKYIKSKDKVINFGLPRIVDKSLTPVEALVGNGSKVKVKAEVIPFQAGPDYPAGIKLNLVAIQVLDLIEYTPTEREDSLEGFEQLEAAKDKDFAEEPNTSEDDVDEAFK